MPRNAHAARLLVDSRLCMAVVPACCSHASLFLLALAARLFRPARAFLARILAIKGTASTCTFTCQHHNTPSAPPPIPHSLPSRYTTSARPTMSGLAPWDKAGQLAALKQLRQSTDVSGVLA